MGSSLFILLYKPFGISSPEDPWYVDLIVLSLGLLFILTILFFEWLIPSIFPRFFQKWNLGKAIIWYSIVILFIGAVNFFYKSYLGGFADFTWIEFFNVLGRVMVIAVTVSFFILGIWNYLNQRKLSMTTLNEEYVVSSQTGQTLRLKLADILYITSDDNYVDIHYVENGARKKTLFRSSLKNVESQIVHRLSPIRRCHRQFLINTRHLILSIRRKAEKECDGN